MILKTKFKDLLVFKNKSFKDKRGYFKELLREQQIKKKLPFYSNVLLKKKRY